MGWSLDYQAPKEPLLLNRLFLAVGRAVYVASSFEEKCQWVLRLMKITDYHKATGDGSATAALARALKDKTLGPTIRDLNNIAPLNESDLAAFERARDARNYIAHESARVGSLSSASAKTIDEKITRLKTELEALTAADNVVSTWIYEIEEKEPAPRGIQDAYPKWVLQWVFEGTYGT